MSVHGSCSIPFVVVSTVWAAHVVDVTDPIAYPPVLCRQSGQPAASPRGRRHRGSNIPPVLCRQPGQPAASPRGRHPLQPPAEESRRRAARPPRPHRPGRRHGHRRRRTYSVPRSVPERLLRKCPSCCDRLSFAVSQMPAYAAHCGVLRQTDIVSTFTTW